MKLSIITVNLNNINGLRQTIASIQSQTWRDFEWLIIDGGSSDGSKEVITTAAQKCPQLAYWCSEPDKGIYNAMNKGILKANGDYYLFLNSGDYLVNPDVLKNISQYIDGTYDIVVGKIQNIDYKIKEPFIAFVHLYKRTLPHQASFISKKCFKKYGLYNESLKIASDWEFFLKALISGNSSIQFITQIISNMQDGGISTDATINNEERNLIISEYYTPQARVILDFLGTYTTVLTTSWITQKAYCALFHFANFIRKIQTFLKR